MIISLAAALSLAAQPGVITPAARWPYEDTQLQVVQRSDGPNRSSCTTTAEGEAQGLIAANLCRLGGSVSAIGGPDNVTLVVEIATGEAPVQRASVYGSRAIVDQEVAFTLDESGAVTDCQTAVRTGGPGDLCDWLRADRFVGAAGSATPRRGRFRLAYFVPAMRIAARHAD